MAAVDSISVIVPATTANLGPGFDCIGAALTLYNEFKFIRVDSSFPLEGEIGKVKITVTGAEAEQMQTDESNLLYQAFVKLYQYLEQTPPPVEIEIKLGVPLARGLGSSATAIVGGLVGANVLAGEPLSQSQVMELAIAMIINQNLHLAIYWHDEQNQTTLVKIYFQIATFVVKKVNFFVRSPFTSR